MFQMVTQTPLSVKGYFSGRERLLARIGADRLGLLVRHAIDAPMRSRLRSMLDCHQAAGRTARAMLDDDTILDRHQPLAGIACYFVTHVSHSFFGCY